MTAIYWDPITPELRDDPYPLWKRMRDEEPVYYNDRLDFLALLAVPRHRGCPQGRRHVQLEPRDHARDHVVRADRPPG